MKCPIEDVVIKKLSKHMDSPGWLVELFRNDELVKSSYPVMSYISMTRPGEARGPHEHKRQSDLFCFLGESKFRVYLWDNRRRSKTYKKKFKFNCAKGQHIFVTVPPGVVHAYKNLGNTSGLVFNAPNQLYKGKNRTASVDEIRHEDDPHTPFKLMR